MFYMLTHIVPALYIDRIWGAREYYYNIPKAIFYQLKGDHNLKMECF